MNHHVLELSQSLSPTFEPERIMRVNDDEISPFELSLLCGILNFPISSFSIDGKEAALSIEWVQMYPI
jgi:hypothetical protein